MRAHVAQLRGAGARPPRRHDRARELIEEELEIGRRFGAPEPLGEALRVRALLVPGREMVEPALEAVDVLAASDLRLAHARGLIDLGAALRRGGHRRDAREPLREGLDLANRCGSVIETDRAMDELHAAARAPGAPRCGASTRSRRKTPGRDDGHRGPGQPRNRRSAVPHPADGRDASNGRLPEARSLRSRGACSKPRSGLAALILNTSRSWASERGVAPSACCFSHRSARRPVPGWGTAPDVATDRGLHLCYMQRKRGSARPPPSSTRSCATTAGRGRLRRRWPRPRPVLAGGRPRYAGSVTRAPLRAPDPLADLCLREVVLEAQAQYLPFAL